MEDCEQRTVTIPPHTTPPKLLHEGCNLHGAGGRARSPTLWGGTSQETPYLAFGPEPDASYREAPRRASSWELKLLVYTNTSGMSHTKAGTSDHTQGTQGGRVQKVQQGGERACPPASLLLHKQRAQCATVFAFGHRGDGGAAPQ